MELTLSGCTADVVEEIMDIVSEGVYVDIGFVFAFDFAVFVDYTIADYHDSFVVVQDHGIFYILFQYQTRELVKNTLLNIIIAAINLITIMTL